MRAATVNTFSKARAIYITILLTVVSIAKVVCTEMFGVEAKAAPTLGGRPMLAYTLHMDWVGENM
jgi:hypothetical protein